MALSAFASVMDRVAATHTGADFEAGRLGQRNGEQPHGHDTVKRQRRTRRPAHWPQPETGNDGKKRKPAVSAPARMGPIWATVQVTGKERETNPELKCRDCGHPFCGGVAV